MVLVLVFCVKQKTAYELGISDWGSDVCSSDLRSQHESDDVRAMGRARGPQAAGGRAARAEAGTGADRGPFGRRQLRHDVGDRGQVPAQATPSLRPQRTSVVEGKSVSVRVDLGCRGITKKTKKQAQKNTV